MKKLFLILLAICFFGCSVDSSDESEQITSTVVEKPSTESPEDTTTTTTDESKPVDKKEKGEQTTSSSEPETTTTNPTVETSEENTENNETTEDVSNTTEPTTNETVVTEPVYEKPIFNFADSDEYCDYDYKFGFTISNYSDKQNKIRIFYTCDNSDPNVILGSQVGNQSTYYGTTYKSNTFQNVLYSATSVTVKAIAYYNDRIDDKNIHIASDIIEKTYTMKQYNITYESDLPYSYLPSNKTVMKGSYTFSGLNQYYPDVRGYWFSHYEVNGERYEDGNSFTITSDVTIKYCWSEWELPWYDESEVPSNFTKIESGKYDDVDSTTYLAYRVTVDNYIYTFLIDKSTISTFSYRGNKYTSFSNSIVRKNAINNGTVGRQLASYRFSCSELNYPNRAKFADYSGNKYYTTVYTNLNTNSHHNSFPTELYINLSELRNINF